MNRLILPLDPRALALRLYVHSQVPRPHMHAQILRDDAQGLTILAYALGAAAVLAPLAILLFAFGTDAATQASDQTNQLLDGLP